MKFSEQKKNDDKTVEINEEKAASSVHTFCGNSEWDERNEPNGRITRTGLYERRYRNKSGGFTAVIDAEAIQFRDADGKIKKIENTLVLDETQDERYYKNKANIYSVQFPQTLDSKVFSVEHGSAKIEFSLINPTENEFSPAIKKRLKGCFKNATGRNAVIENDTTIKYLSVAKDTNMVYSVSDNCVKENIILCGKRSQYKFAFTMRCTNVFPRIIEGGEIVFFSKEDPDNGYVFYIPAPVMFDAQEAKSDNLHYEINQIGEDSDNYLFMVVADKDWINAKDRIFPVTIDPQVVIGKTDSSPRLLTVDQYIANCYCNSSLNKNTSNYSIWNNGCEYSNLLVNVMNPAKCASVFDKSVRVMRASLIWAITGGNNCGHLNVRVGDKLIERLRYDGPKELRVDITNQMNEMIRDGKDSFSVIFDVDCDSNCEQYIYMKQGKDALSLLVDYIPLDIVGQNSESVSFDVKSAGKGSINLATQNVIFEHADVTADSAIMPVSVSHVFDGDRGNAEFDSIHSNGATSQVSPGYNMGKGWKLNVQQTLVVPDRNVPYRSSNLVDALDKIYYIDGSGEKITFEKKYFYIANGVKHFIAESNCEHDGNKNLVIDSNGCYSATIDNKTVKVYGIYMSDNGLFVSLDQSKAMYLDEREYEKYYEYQGTKYPLRWIGTNRFEYDAYEVVLNGRKQEVDFRSVKKNDNGTYTVRVDLRETGDGIVELPAIPKTYEKYLYKDNKGEYFTTYSPECCCSGTAYNSFTSVRVDVFSVNLFTQDAVSLSNAHFSSELINVDTSLSEINRAIAEFEATYESYIDQQIALRKNQNFTEQLQLMRKEYNEVQTEMMGKNVEFYQAQYVSTVQESDKAIEDLNEQRQDLDEWNEQNVVERLFNENRKMFRKNEETASESIDSGLTMAQNNKKAAEQAKISADAQHRMMIMQQTMDDLQYAKSLENVEDQINALWDARQKVSDQKRIYLDLRAKKMEERTKIIEQEKKLPCDYIYDESGNVLVFDYYGRLIAVQDTYRNTTQFTYDGDVLSAIVTSDEQEISLSYNDSGRLESITDTNGRITKYVYDSNNRLVKIISPEYDVEHPWAKTSFTYDGNGKLLMVKDQSGYFVSLNYEIDNITISEHTSTYQIKDNEVVPWNYNEIVDGGSTTVEFRTPFITAVTKKNKTVVYQMDVTGKVLTTYEEISRQTDNRMVVSNTTSFEYRGKKRAFSVQADVEKANLLTNGNFASTSGWSIVGGGTTSAYSVDGSNGLVIYGDSDYNRRVYQTVTSFVPGKRHYLLSLWAKATSAQIDSERCTGYENQYLESHINTELFDGETHRKFGIKAAVTYANGTMEDFYASFDWYNTDWQLCQLPMCLKGEPVKMVVSFEYGYNVGYAYIDNFRLTEEYGSENRFSDDGKLLWSCDGNTQRFYTYNGGAYPVQVLEVDCEDARSNGCTQNCAECNGNGTCKHSVNKYGFNTKGQLLWSESSNGIITKNTYDDKGRKTASSTYHESDPTSKFVSESVYDDKGRETETMDPRGEVNGEKLSQKMGYELGTNLMSSVVSAGGKKTVYGYHHLTDACVSVSADDEGVEHINHMNYTAGLLTRVDNGAGMWYNYVYNGFGKLIKVLINGDVVASYGETDFEDGTVISTKSLDGVAFTSTTDDKGRINEIKVGDTVLKNGYIYDAADRCTAYIEFPNDSAKKKAHSFTYGDTESFHTAGNVTATYQKDSKGKTVRTTYRFSETNAATYDFAYEDSFDGTLKSITYNNSIEQSFAHDKLGRQTESRLTNSCGSTVYAKRAGYLKHGNHTTNLISDLKHNVLGAVSHEKYRYDAEGNISAIYEDGKLKARFTYDNLNRLIREDNKDLGITTVFAYDNGGNLLRQREYAFTVDSVENLDETNTFVYCYGNENRPDQLTSFNGQTISYDANGCPTSYFGNACTFEYGTRMTKFGSNTFSYDADGLRSTKNNVAYTYIDGKLIRQTGGAAGKIDFIYGASGVIGFKYNEAYYFYRRNLMGDVTHIYNENGTLVAQYVYDAWGNHQINTDVNGIGTLNPIRYRGYYYDTETGLYYLRARYYDPETGRFISQDDVSYLAPTHLSGLNLYAYCNDNPVMGYDPNGCFEWKTLFGYAMAFGLAAIAVVGIVASGGALLIPVLVGAGVGLAVNVIGQGVGNLISRKGFFDGFSIESALMGMLAGAAFAAAGGFWATVAVGAMANAGTSALQQKSWKQIALSAIGGAISAGVGYALGKLVGCEVYGDDDMTITDYRNMARLDEGEIRAWGTAFASSWKSLLPNIANSGTRGILKFLSNKGIDLF